jgi:hypothetical protein
MKIALLRILIATCLCVVVAAQQKAGPNWDAWQFMQGKWVGEGSSELGAGSGYFTFEPDLQNKAWVRRNYSKYPATKDRPMYVHEDLMIVYFDPITQQTRAFYYDTEGHEIHYTATWSADGNIITFLSDASETGPRFRLTYLKGSPGHMSLTLEMAKPDKPDEFHNIVQGKVRKLPS